VALTVARRALDLAQRQKEHGHEAWVLRLLGELAGQADVPDVEAAEEHYSGALARATELGMRPLVAHCHLGLGTLYRRMDKGRRPRSISPPRPRCIARWAWGSGWRKPKRRSVEMSDRDARFVSRRSRLRPPRRAARGHAREGPACGDLLPKWPPDGGRRSATGPAGAGARGRRATRPGRPRG
jgi:hypothetical protein